MAQRIEVKLTKEIEIEEAIAVNKGTLTLPLQALVVADTGDHSSGMAHRDAVTIYNWLQRHVPKSTHDALRAIHANERPSEIRVERLN